VYSIDTSRLIELLDEDVSLTLLDVRSTAEFAEWSIPGATNIPLDELPERIGEIPEGTLVTVCARGRRAEEASALLAHEGVESSVLAGGMAAWGRAYDQVAVHLGDATVVQIRRRGKGCLSYVVGAGEACLVIDPSLDLEQYLATASAHGWRITHVADTHLHADHLSGAKLLAESTGAVHLVNLADPFTFEGSTSLETGSIKLSTTSTVSIGALSTPGHTRGSTTFDLDGRAMFTGDELFIESVGRPDLADHAVEFAHDLYRSIHESLLQHDDATLVMPAHFGPSVEISSHELVAAPLGRLRAEMAPLRLNEEAFVAWAASQAAPRPPNYVAIVEANMAGIVMGDEERETLESGPNRCAVDAPH